MPVGMSKNALCSTGFWKEKGELYSSVVCNESLERRSRAGSKLMLCKLERGVRFLIEIF